MTEFYYYLNSNLIMNGWVPYHIKNINGIHYYDRDIKFRHIEYGYTNLNLNPILILSYND